MTLHLHHLTGCAPTPLAHYLKAIGILRVVAEQADPSARGFWEDEHFCLMTALDREALESFFLEAYAPTPFVSPWNKGSGFYAAHDPALSPLRMSTAPRFAPFRAGIAAGEARIRDLAEADAIVRAIKNRAKARAGMSAAQKREAAALKHDPEHKKELAAAERRFKELKGDLFTPCLREWRGPHRAWMDTALVWLEGEGRPDWPSLLGTGGNDGRLDFTNNAMQRLQELFDVSAPDGVARPGSAGLLQQALWDAPCNLFVASAAIGQFHPGDAGGANTTSAATGDSLINPWDFVLMLEGTIPFGGRATKRLDPRALSRASAPFAVRSHPIGHGTGGRENAQRGEQWMPLWSAPTTLLDLQALLAEGRLQFGRQVATRPIDVALAVSRLGIARGVSSFVRYGYLERNGQSQMATPLGRLGVRERPAARLVDDIALWADRLQRLARDEHAPARLVVGEHAFSDTIFAALTHDDSPQRWQAILLAASEVETMQASGTAFEAGPIPPLSPEWLVAADDGSPEWRLARTLGSAAAGADWKGRRSDPVRHHWLPLEQGARRYKKNDRRLVLDPRVVMTGRDAVTDLGALVERRLIEAAQNGRRVLQLLAAPRYEALPGDLDDLLAGRVDLNRVSSLARALMAIRWDRAGDVTLAPVRRSGHPPPAWLAVRLALLPWPLREERAIPADETIVRRLRSGDGSGAVTVALRRLAAAGLRPPLQAGYLDEPTARLWAAALAFPIGVRWATQIAREFEPSLRKEVP